MRWGVEWRDDKMEGGGRRWSNVPAQNAPAGGQILFMETIWQALSEQHQTALLYVSLTFVLKSHLYATPSAYPNLLLISIGLPLMPLQFCP